MSPGVQRTVNAASDGFGPHMNTPLNRITLGLTRTSEVLSLMTGRPQADAYETAKRTSCRLSSEEKSIVLQRLGPRILWLSTLLRPP